MKNIRHRNLCIITLVDDKKYVLVYQVWLTNFFKVAEVQYKLMRLKQRSVIPRRDDAPSGC